MTERFRGFIAAPLPDGALQELVRIQDTLRSIAERHRLALRWSRPEHLHVTLKFLGYLSRAHVDELAASVAHRASEVTPAQATIPAVGVFGSPRRARVLHVDITDPDNVLSLLAAAFETDAERFGVPREQRKYTPHITLARFSNPGNASALLEQAFTPIAVRFDVVRLYESRPGRAGSSYTVLAEAALGSASV